ncbi:DedA family protein [Vogesella mureinivorans]|jgi:membrane protein DedA with SNARE-associated domain|uniref:DedA family protein n=1 Tax=Vogesella mureinivorans TaxID=657276 RepID=UPI0011C8D825|nr:DedA family protein [Vogesella mureinivorans]
MDILQLLLDFFTGYGYFAVFIVLLVCGFGVPIPEDITLVAGGIISGLGYTNVHWMFAVGMAGVLVGDGIMFAAGRLYGERVLRFRPVAKIMTPERFAATQEKFARYGNWVLFVARFLPGLRSPIFLTAGMTRRIPYWRFLMMDGFAALISVPVWVYLGYFGARNREWLMHMVHRGQAGILIALAVAGLVLGVYFWRKKRKAANAGA